MMTSRRALAITLLLLGIGLIACGTQVQATPTSAPPTAVQAPAATKAATPTAAKLALVVASNVSFSKNILPLFQNYCVNCHGGQRTENGLNLSTYEGVMVGGKGGAVVHAGNANGSQLVQMILQGKMPKRGTKPTSDQVQLIEDWINQGAVNN
ncbi:MAG TPA: c-type cytochrome domain-containing protein [Anaerolineales bacterium]|nr:c-type cytochrome domain-containing protein [Anaerolineales bacterium]